ncbi:MAG: class I SAM-dependent methyltransferase [Firmicutes bacterium]|nr:class I SAM-dependent methyltransferase [Bacillota bacterium]
MNTPKNWKDYQIIATGSGEKLEKWGEFYLLRPDPQAIWESAFDLSTFPMLHGKYTRSQTGGGQWEWFKSMPPEWHVRYENLKFIISPTAFKHTGLFPEQAFNWEKLGELCSAKTGASLAISPDIRVLNLFGYTGGATVACAYVGANVTHVDASKGMTEVCKRNAELNKIDRDKIRYIVDDCAKFVSREIRRGKTYDGIIMDPPSYGRGTGGEVWKIEQSLDPLVFDCCKLLSKKPKFILINSYTTGLQPTVIKNILKRNLDKAKIKGYTIEAYEIGVDTLEGITLPCGCSAIAIFK